MYNRKHFILAISVFFSVLIMLWLPAMPQDVHYHDFADQRAFFGIPNFLNVVSNIPYLLVGLMGCLLVFRETQLTIIKSIKHVYVIFFMAVALICFGSSYYHLNPSNATLLWDRIPMAITFMAFFSVILAEYVDKKSARQLFIPLLLLGLVSVVYWHWTESMGQGDLRFYILVQFLPVILIPLILWLFSSCFTHSYIFWLIIGCYVLAKSLELTDQFVFESLGIVSGHSLKHLVSALGPYLFYLALKMRTAGERYQY